ncbi:MAG: hypothetical protein ACRDRU_08885 [Pseudonocardiaceae bacterium]
MTNVVLNREDREPKKATPEQDKEIAELQKRTPSGHHVFEYQDGGLRGCGPTRDAMIREGTVRKPDNFVFGWIITHRERTKRPDGTACPGDVFHYKGEGTCICLCMKCGKDINKFKGNS